MTQGRPVFSLLKETTTLLQKAGIETARLDAELLLAFVAETKRLDLLCREISLTDQQLSDYQALIKRRLSFEPVAYLLGEQEFWSLPFKVNEHVLIPRPDTETLVEAVLHRVPQAHALLDLGTGSGCVLLSLLSEFSDSIGVGVDQSAEAIALARENAVSLGFADRASLIVSDWFSRVEKPHAGFDVIVSNPPYIRADDMPGLMPDVLYFEPHSALVGGEDGLNPYRHIIKEAHVYLRPNGLLAFELGAGQADSVTDIFDKFGYKEIEKHKDLAGVERVVSAKKY